MSKKDAMVKTGEYTNSNGETKGRYENVGVLMEGESGPYMLLKKTFNPAGVVDKKGGDMILISFFEQKPKVIGQSDYAKADGDIPF